MDEAPFPDHDFAARRDRLRARLDENGVEVLYVTRPANVAYLTGFTGSNGQVLVARQPDGDALLTDPRYAGRAAHEAPDLDTVVLHSPLTQHPFDEVLDRTDGRIGFEGAHVSYDRGVRMRESAAERDREAVACDDMVEPLRVVKDSSELVRLRAACRITTEAFTAMLDGLHPGRTERDLAVELERRFVDLGADGLAFDPIVASGPNGATPHHEPGSRAIEPGDLVTFDIGARVDGYHADFTRTVAVGQPHPAWVEIHQLVVAAQQAGVVAATAGTTCEKVDAAARDPISEAGHADAFVHGIGHGVGLEIHEAPIVSAVPAASLDASTVITIEPGVYLQAPAGGTSRQPSHDVPAGGVRIEDAVLVTRNGPAESLTVAPHDLLVLPG